MWHENITIGKNLTLRGTGRDQRTVQLRGSFSPVISIGSDSEIQVTLNGLTAEGAEGSNGIQVTGKVRVVLTGVRLSGGGTGLRAEDSVVVHVSDSVIQDQTGCGIWAVSKAQVRGTPNEMRGNGADLCGFVPASVRKPLVLQSDKTQLEVPEDFKNLQEAVDAIALGGTIVVQTGSYEAGLTLWKPVVIRGLGTEQTELKPLPGHLPLISVIAEAQGVTIEGLTAMEAPGAILIYGQATLQGVHVSGLMILGPAQVNLQNSRISDGYYQPLPVWDSATVSLVHSHVSGYRIDVSGSAHVSLINSSVSNSADDGLSAEGSAQVSLIGSAVFGNGQNGLSVSGGATVEMSDSVIQSNKGCGIQISSKEVQMRGTSNAMLDNGADLCGFASASLRKPLVPQTSKTQLTVPEDFASLQVAVDALAPGGTIVVQSGSYEVGLTLWKPVVLLGQGQGQTILQARVGYRLVVSVIAEAHGVVLEGLTVTGSQGGGLLVYGQATLQNTQISDNDGAGVLVQGSGDVNLTDYSQLSRNGGGLSAWNSANMNLTNIQVYDNRGGLYLQDSTTATLTDTRVSGNSENGLEVRSAATVSLTDSQISGNGKYGLWASGQAQTSLTSSTVSGNGTEGLFVQDSATVSLRNSEVSHNGHAGLRATNSSRLEVESSTVEDNGTSSACQLSAYSFDICSGITLGEQVQLRLISSAIRGNTDWGLAAWLKSCGYDDDSFVGNAVFQGSNAIEGNNTSGNQNGMDNPANHPFKNLPDGQVCLP